MVHLIHMIRGTVLEAVFRGHLLYVATGAVITLMVGWSTYRRVVGSIFARFYVALWVMSLVMVVYLTLWSTGGTAARASCALELNLVEPFSTTQGILNAGMYVPVGLLGVLALRRPPVAMGIGLLLTASVETLQGAIPALGRACDTTDLCTNAVGTLLGAFLGWVILRAGRIPTDWGIPARRYLLAPAGLVVTLAATWIGLISVHPVASATVLGDASPQQRTLMMDRMNQAFGQYYEIVHAQFISTDGSQGTIDAGVSDGLIELSWPKGSEFRADLSMSAPQPSGFPVDPSITHISSAEGAKALATRYASSHFPSETNGSVVTVEMDGSGATDGWTVRFRKTQPGAVAPAQLDVSLSRSGRVVRVFERTPPDSAPSVS